MPLIPVDHVAEGIAASLADSQTEGLTLHWTPHRLTTVGELNVILAKLLATEPVKLDPSASWPVSSREGSGQSLWHWLRMHRVYFTGGLRFDRHNADAVCERHGLEVPQIDEALLGKIHRHWSWATRRRRDG